MKILLTAAQFSSNISGLQRHALNVVRCLLTQPTVEEIHFVIAPWQQEMIRSAGLGFMARVHLHVAEMGQGMLSRNLWYYRRLPALVRQVEPDVVHLTYPVPVNSSTMTRPIVLTLHDLYPYEIPDNFGFPKVFFNRAILRLSLHRAHAIACVSEATRERLKQFASRDCWDRALRISNCVEPETECAQRSPIADWQGAPFLLSVSQHRRNKNIALLLAAFHRLLREGRISHDMRLVVVGITGPETPSLKRLIVERDLGDRIVFLQGLSEPQLQWCYRTCEALVAPSATEGFGLPVAEALLAGARVVCSDIPAFREIDAAHCRFVPLDSEPEERLAAAIEASLREPAPAPVALPQFSKEVIGLAYAELYGRLIRSAADPCVTSHGRTRSAQGRAEPAAKTFASVIATKTREGA